MKRLIELGLWALAGGSFCLSPFAAAAWATPLEPVPVLDDEKEDEGEDEDADDAEEEKDRWFAAVGGDVYSGTGGLLRGATVLAKNGRIERIGYDVDVPDEAEVLDATNMRVYPGLVAYTSTGLFGTTTDFEDSVDPFNSRMTLALAGGITTAGQSMKAVKLKRFEVEDPVVSEDVLHSVGFSNRNPTGKAEFREKLRRATEYEREYAQYEELKKEDEDLKEPSKKGLDTNVLAILQGRKRALFAINDRSELLEVARLAQEYDFRPVIQGCVEGWTVADELGRAGAYAIVTPRFRNDKSETLVRDGGSTIENAAILHRSGVQVAVIPSSTGIDMVGIVGRDIMHLPVEAAFAVRGGLPEDAAFAAITSVPARILGAGDRIGSLAVGKDCDLIITDGDILHYETFVQWAVVDGKVVYDKEEELYFAHIRPRPESELAPEERLDPGEVEEEEGEDEEGDEESDDGEESDDE